MLKRNRDKGRKFPAKQGEYQVDCKRPTPLQGRFNREFTLKQQRFIDCYDGDIKEAAQKAGLSCDYARKLVIKIQSFWQGCIIGWVEPD